MSHRARPIQEPRVSVVILNYNGLRWLNSCLTSILTTKYSNYDVHLIDNASTDRSVEYVQREHPAVRIIRNSSNLGFADAYNNAIDQINTEYIVLLNNDTEVLNPKWLAYLVKVATQNTNVAAVATRMVSMRDKRILDSVGGAGVPYWRGFFNIGMGEEDVGRYLDSFEPFAYCGGAALIRKAAFVDAGKLDPAFYAYYDDPDLSWRFRLRGWHLRYASRAKVAHYMGGTAGHGEITPTIFYYCNRNFLRSIIKNCGSSLPWALRNYLLHTILETLGYLIYEPKRSIHLVKGIFWNIRNFNSTYAARHVVQSRRKVGEAEILRSMYPGIAHKQTARHFRLVKLLDTLFEYGSEPNFRTIIAKPQKC